MSTPPAAAYVTKTGRLLSDADIDARADDVVGDIAVNTFIRGHADEARVTLVRALVRAAGLEPARLSTPGSKPGASANFATPA